VNDNYFASTPGTVTVQPLQKDLKIRNPKVRAGAQISNRFAEIAILAGGVSVRLAANSTTTL
jgi:hypothetical protein